MPTTTANEIREAARKLSAADHPGIIRAFYPYWDAQYRPYLLMAVEAFPLDKLDFKPRPEVMTARQMILHIAEVEHWWISHIVGGEPYEDWVVELPDSAQGYRTTIDAPDHGALFALLEQWHGPTQRWLEQPVTELDRVYAYQPKDGPKRRYTLHWILDHVQEHEIHHRAQLNFYLRVMGITPPSI